MREGKLRWWLGLSILLAVVTTLPYFVGFARQSEAWRFTGFVFAVEDGNSYIAKMLQGAEGSWLFRTPYSAEPQGGILAFLPYLLLGKLASPPGMHTQLVALFHLFRMLAIPVLVLAMYRLAGEFLENESWRRWVVWVGVAGGGLGWVLLLWNAPGPLQGPPLEFYSPESFGFLALFGIPHLVVARALLLLAMVNYLQAAATPRRGWLAGICLFAMGFFQPITIVTGFAVIGMHQLLLGVRSFLDRDMGSWWPWLRAGLRAGLLPFPFLIYNLWKFSSDPYLRRWAAQNIIRSPAPAQYLLSYGLLLIPALAGLWLCWRRRGQARDLLLVAWVLILPALAYFPHNLQRRLPDGAWVSLTLLAAIALERWFSSAKLGSALGVSLAGASLVSSMVLVLGGLGAAINPAPPVFRSGEEVGTFQWIAEHGKPGEAVLAAYATGNALPAWAPMHVLIGHGPESADLAQLEPRVADFYSGDMGAAERQGFLMHYGVSWVFWGPAERALGSFDPAESGNLTLAERQGEYCVYAVGRSQAGDGN
jgi:hypothetical protein